MPAFNKSSELHKRVSGEEAGDSFFADQQGGCCCVRIHKEIKIAYLGYRVIFLIANWRFLMFSKWLFLSSINNPALRNAPKLENTNNV